MGKFGNLNKEDWEQVKSLLEKNDLVALKRLHDEKELSDYVYGCCDLDGLKKWFEWGMQRNIEK